MLLNKTLALLKYYLCICICIGNTVLRILSFYPHEMVKFTYTSLSLTPFIQILRASQSKLSITGSVKFCVNSVGPYSTK